MSDFWNAAALWTAQSMVAGGAALLLAWLAARRIADPARRHRAMGWSVRAAVLACVLALLPAWWKLPVPGWKAGPTEKGELEFVVAEAPSAVDDLVFVPMEFEVAMPEVAAAGPESTQPLPAVLEPKVQMAIEPPAEPVQPRDMMAEVVPILLVPYWICVGVALLRQLVGYIGLARLRRAAKPANERVQQLAVELANGSPLPRILVSERLATPVCFGVLTPTILLPKPLVKFASADQLRWVLAHELDHLNRRDPRTGVWVGLARAFYFAVPWFWAVRREIHLTQEYLADAAAAGARTADYAAFLVELSSRPGVSRVVKAVPSLAGVRAGQSDLYRRVTMLLEPKNGRKSRWGHAWTTLAIGGAVSVAVSLSGVRLTADEPKAEKKPDDVKVEVKVRDKKPDGDKKPADVHEFEFIVVADTSKQSAEIEKAIEEAAKKGDVEAVKKLVTKLKALASAPQIARIKNPGFPVPPVPPAPPVVARIEKFPGEGPVKVLAARAANDETKKLEEAVAKMKKAIEDVKDQPEAKAALEKTVAEYHKKIAEAQEKGQLKKFEEAKDAKGQQFKLRVDGAAAGMDQVKAQMAEMKKAYEKQLEAFKDDAKASEAVKEAMKKYEESMATLMKQLYTAPRQGQFQWQAVPKVAFAGGDAPNVWVAKTASVDRGRLGVTIEAVPAVIVEQLDLPKGQGVILTAVIEGTPAAKAGLKANDIVLQVAGKAVTVEELPKVVGGLKNDETFEVTIVRKGKKETVKGVTIPAPAKTATKEAKKSSTSMSVSVDNDQFEIVAKEDKLTYTLKGTVGDESGVSIVIADGDKKSEYKGAKSVPAEHREKVAKFLKSVGGNK